MPRFIFSDSREELIQKRNAWQMKYDARKQLYDDQQRNYNKASWTWKDNLTSIVNKQFSSYINKLPGLRIDVDRYWGIRIRFEYEPRRDNTSLKWSYEVILEEDTGDIKKESNSWSGFNAVTPEQIEDLTNSVNLLKAIVEFDWAPLLKEAQRNQPRYEQYMGVRNPDYDDEYKDPGFDKMIREADIEEAVASGEWIKGPKTWKGSTWYFILSRTPKFYNVVKFDDSNIQDASNGYYEQYAEIVRHPQDASSYYREKIKKDNISFASPVETKTPEELLQYALNVERK